MLALLSFALISHNSTAQNLNWAGSVGQVAQDSATAVAHTSNGGFVIVGRGTQDDFGPDYDPFGGSGAYGGPQYDWHFIAKYDNQGQLQNIKIPDYGFGAFQNNNGGNNALSSTQDEFTDVAVDGSGNIYVTGTFNQDLEFDVANGPASPHELYPVNYNGDLLVLKLDPALNPTFSFNAGADAKCVGHAIDANLAGDFFVGGQYSNNTSQFDLDKFTAGNQTPTNNSGFMEGAFLAAYDNTNNLTWSIGFGGSHMDDAIYDVATDNLGNVICVGQLTTANSDFNPLGSAVTLSPVGSQDLFIASYNSVGQLNWVKLLGDSGSDAAYSVTIDDNNNCYVSGEFSGTFSFDGTPVNAIGQDGFLAKYSGTGNLVWLKTISGAASERLLSVDENNGQLICSGDFTSDLIDDLGTFNSTGGTDGYLAQIDTAGNLISSKHASAAGNNSVVGSVFTGTNDIISIGSLDQVSSVTLDQSQPGNALSPAHSNLEWYFANFCTTPEVNLSSLPALCEGDAPMTLDGNGSPSGGSYSGIGIINGAFYPLLVGAGSYDMVYEYQYGACVNSDTQTIVVNPNPIVQLAGISDFCENDNSHALVEGIPVGGSYSGTGVNSGNFDPQQAGSGIHTINYTYTDANGCTDDASQPVLVNDAPDINVSTTDADCANPNGTASASASGGALPYLYYWSTGNFGQNISGLSGGFYQITVTDGNGCSNFEVANVSDINGPQITINSVTDVTCFGDEDGAIDVAVSGGTGNLHLSWSNGDTTALITDLAAGPYDLLVEDDAGCSATISVLVNSPDDITITPNIVNAGCGQQDGSISIVAAGGNNTFTYDWPASGNTTDTESSIGLGVYTVIVSDGNSCSNSFDIALNETGGPIISIDNITNTPCGSITGAVDITPSGAGPFTFNWQDNNSSTVSLAEDLTGVASGNYVITVTDTNNCSSTEPVVVGVSFQDNIELCLITVDTTSGKNLLVWEKPTTSSIDFFNIYREGSMSGVYDLVDTVHYNSLSQYTDLSADPLVRSWRYKISAVDQCGNESVLSTFHKTIHLTSNYGINNDINLNWDDYLGFPYSTYYIWRWSDVDGWNQLGSVPSNLNSYTDVNPPFSAMSINYMIEAVPDQPCVSTRANHNTTRSNRTQPVAGPGANSIHPYNQLNVSIYPNPATNGFFIDSFENSILQFKLYTQDGKIVQSGKTSGKAFIPTSSLAKGMYSLSISNDQHQTHQKIIIQ